MPGLLVTALHVQGELDRTVGAEVGTGAIPEYMSVQLHAHCSLPNAEHDLVVYVLLLGSMSQAGILRHI